MKLMKTMKTKMKTMKTKSALSYFGSDSEVAEALSGMLDHCKHVTIPFVGGAAILPHLKARAIVANDLNGLAINFYRVMSGWYGNAMKEELIQRCQTTLSHPDNMELAEQQLELNVNDHIELAWSYWAACWIGRKGKGGTKFVGGMPSVRRTANGGTNASRIIAAANDLPAWAKHFERCEWESVCFRELLPKVADNPECGIYCDPPWVGAGRDYLHSFTEQDHRDLFDKLNLFECATIVVRYGDSPLIRDLYKNWNIIEANSRTQANSDCDEIWLLSVSI
jgi:site-specific DNA-adenine methylase